MMVEQVLEHPTSEELTSFALSDNDGGTIGGHLAECPACARYVKEVDFARKAVANLPEQDVPEDLERRILSHQKPARTEQSMWGRPGEWYRSPFLVGLSVILGSIFLVVFFLFVLH
jgi:anti-sigma factor RsiW